MNTDVTNASKKRIEWIDMLRGFAIICVILGHRQYGGVAKLFGVEIYSFHIPLFFFLSGIVFSIKKNYTFKSFVVKKIKTILLPMVFFSLIQILFNYVYHGLIVGVSKYTLQHMIDKCIGIVCQLRDGKYQSTLWFLTCLFVTQLLLYWIIKTLKDKTMPILIALLVCFAIGAVYMSLGLPRLPWEIDCSFVTVFFTGLGYLFKKENILKTMFNKLWLIPILIVLNVTTMYANYIYMGKHGVDLGYSEIGMPILFILESFAAIFALVIIFSRLKRIKWLAYIGENSLVYYGLLDLMVFIPDILIYNILHFNGKDIRTWSIPISIFYVGVVCLSIVPINELINRKLRFMKGQF